MQNRDRSKGYRIIESAEKTELQQFASWFHQDWNTVFPDFYRGARMYFDSIPLERREALKAELNQFIRSIENSGASQAKRAWFKLGAEAWPPKLDIFDALNDFLEMSTQE